MFCEVVGGRALLVERLLELAVEDGQLLIERLQLLVRRLEFLVGGLELLIDRHRLFMDRPNFFLGDVAVADGGLEVPARGVQLLLEAGDPREVGRRLQRRLGGPLPGQRSMKLRRIRSSPAFATVRAVTLTGAMTPSRRTRPAALTSPGCCAALSIAVRIAGRRPSRAVASTSKLGSPAGSLR